MTGKDLIVYILENELENEPIFNDEKFIGCLTAEEVAVEEGVGISTVYTWFTLGMVPGFMIGSNLYIFVNYKSTKGWRMRVE